MTTTIRVGAVPGEGLVARVTEQDYDGEGTVTNESHVYMKRGETRDFHAYDGKQITVCEMTETQAQAEQQSDRG